MAQTKDNPATTRDTAPSREALASVASRVGPLVIGRGLVMASRAVPATPEHLATLEAAWRFDAA